MYSAHATVCRFYLSMMLPIAFCWFLLVEILRRLISRTSIFGIKKQWSWILLQSMLHNNVLLECLNTTIMPLSAHGYIQFRPQRLTDLTDLLPFFGNFQSRMLHFTWVSNPALCKTQQPCPMCCIFEKGTIVPTFHSPFIYQGARFQIRIEDVA